MARTHKISLVSFSLVLALYVSSGAQYPFGKNKVIYSKKDWKVLETEHVDIYHYPPEKNLVILIAPIVEETYKEYSVLFNLEFRNRLPFVLFSSHYDFQQTNIIPNLIPDYTAGFTDLIKGRIAIPFQGSLASLRHVVRHEMVHAFMLEKLDQVMNSKGKYTFPNPPLWFVEGMAEYIASPNGNTRSRMFIRDALLNEILPGLKNLWRIEGSFLMYKEGEAVVQYIARNFGDEAVIKILDNWWTSDRFSRILEKTINMDVDELNDAFFKSIKRMYYPSILHSSFAPDIGKQISPERSFHSHPAAYVSQEDGSTQVIALCARHGAINICKTIRKGDDRYRQETMIEGSTSSSFESIPAMRSKLEIKGDTLIFVSKSKERDVIYLWSISANNKINCFSFPSLSMISSPTLSPDGGKLVFSAIDSSGMTDLYLYNLENQRLERLTRDPFSEEGADFHPRDDLLLFSSDRCKGPDGENSGIYLLDLDSREIKTMTCGNGMDSEPEWSPSGDSFLFTSDMDGSYNIYLYKEGSLIKQTSVIGGVSMPAFLPGGDGFVAVCYHRGEFRLFEFPLNGFGDSIGSIPAPTDSSALTWDSNGPKEEFSFQTKDYRMKLGLDLIGTGIALDPDFGEVGNGAQILLSDILGNHQFYAFIGNTSEGFDDFWKRLNVGITYVNLSHRLNYMIGAFHLTTFWGDYFSLFRSERRYGGIGGISYPFSKFSRIEALLVLKAIERETDFSYYTGDTRSSFLASNFFMYVADNTLWTIGGPLKGTRYYVTVGKTYDLMNRGFDNATLHLDFRRYFKISDRILLAERFINRNSWGSDLQLFYLGGPWDLRGHDFRRYAGKSIYLLNSELRFPLIDRFSLSFPFGTLEMPSIRGSIFFDAGRVDRFIEDTGWIGSIGVGTELNLGYAPVIRVNFTRTTDFDTISNDIKVGLFIGYNY